MSQIKILHLIPTLLSGGAERQLVNLVNSTSKDIVDHVVCVINNADFFGSAIRDVGYKIIELKIPTKRPFFQTTSKFRKVIREEKPDIIHSWLYDANVAARLANLPYKIPIITSLQSPDYAPEARKAGNWNPKKVYLLRMIDKFTVFLTKPYFVPCSEYAKKSYQAHLGIDEAKTRVIYNSVDAKLLTVSADELKGVQEELRLPKDNFVYISVGRLDAPKNHKTLIDAFKQVSIEVPNSTLIIVGEGILKNTLINQANNLGIADKVLFLGRRSDVGALLEIADVFVFPSLLEGLPVALVEAMFKSLPCIASKIEVLEEVITDEETGLLIDPSSPNELTDAMIKIYKDKDLRKSLSEKGFKKVKETFNTDVTAKQWEEFYQKVKSEI